MPADKSLTRHISQGRKPKIDYRHQIAIDILQLHMTNVEMELIQKRKVVKSILADRALDQTPIHFLGIKIRKLKIELVRLEKSLNLLLKNNKPLKVNIDDLARSSAKIE